MISEERLKELLKEEATIYKVNGYVEEIDLNEYDFGITDKELVFNYKIYAIRFEDLFESKEEAEEYKKYGNITRTEKLELPMWSEVEKVIEQMKHFNLNHSDRVLVRIITKDSLYYLKLYKDLDTFTFELKQTYIGEDLCEQLTSKFPKCLGRATEENYDKARNLCIKLFRGEEGEW